MSVPAVGLVAYLAFASDYLQAQADPQHYQFIAGQSLQPIYQGWSHNPDGSFEMHFGYLNRNYVEELHLPVGPSNRMTPGGPDRGQPTFFYPRVNRQVFSVTVPNDWGDRELVWDVAVRDEAYRAVGWLQPEWEIASRPNVRAFLPLEGRSNQVPTLSVQAARSVTRPGTLTMTATVTDDGLPERRPRRGGAPAVLPSLEPITDGPTIPVNVPQILPENRKQPTRVTVEGVNVTWTLRRGPVGSIVDSPGDPVNGAAVVVASFENPGEYIFRVQASDGLETVTEDVTVTVQ